MADISKMRELCNVLGLNLLQQIQDEVDESISDVDSWSVSDLGAETVNLLNNSVERLSKMKADRFSEIKKKATTIISFWDTLLVPFEKKQELINLVYFVEVESDDEITEVSALSLEFFNKVVREHDKLREQMNALVLKKKSKLMQILKTTHLLSKFVDNKDIADPLEALLDIRKQILEAKDLAFQRAETITKIELIQHAHEEIDWYRSSDNAFVARHNERTVKVDALRIVKTIAEEIDATSAEEGIISTGRTVSNRLEDRPGVGAEKIAADKPGAGAGKIQVEPSTSTTCSTQLLPVEPARLRPLVPLIPDLGFIPRARRTRRVPVEAVLPPAPPSPPPPASPPSPPESDKSDESMFVSDSDDADYDPAEDL